MSEQWQSSTSRLLWVDISAPDYPEVWVEPRAIVAVVEGDGGDAVVMLNSSDHLTIFGRTPHQVLLQLMEKLRSAGL